MYMVLGLSETLRDRGEVPPQIVISTGRVGLEENG